MVKGSSFYPRKGFTMRDARRMIRTGIAAGRTARRVYNDVAPVAKKIVDTARKFSTRFRAPKFTKSKTKSAMVRQKPYTASGGQGTFSKFSSVRRPTPQVRTMKRVGAPNHYITNNAQQILISEGFQDAQVFNIQSQQDLLRMYTNVVGNTTTPPQYAFNNKRFVLESSHTEYMLTNSSLATAYVDIYDIVRKRDTSNNNATVDPRSAWLVGTTYEQNPSNPFSPMNVINSVPTDSQIFRDFFKVVKRTHVSLGTGATHKHSVYLKPNKLVDGGILTQTDGDEAGIAMYTMIVAYGQPASAVAETGTSVTTAKLAIDVVRAIRYKYTFVQNADEVLTFSDGLASLANEQIANAGSGTITANAVI